MKALQKKMEACSKDVHYEFLGIFIKHNVIVNECKDGCLINLSCLQKNVVDELKKCLQRYENIDQIEQEKQKLRQSFFTTEENG
jgi:hypothetical protein